MRKKILISYWIIGTTIIMGLLIACKKLKENYNNNLKLVGATVVSHPNIVMDRGHRIRYITLIKTDDGYIEEIKGIGYYSLPIGSRISISLYR